MSEDGKFDYSDLNKKHFWLIRQIYVDQTGKCLISLRKGGGFSANSPEEADEFLNRMERKESK